MDLSKYFDGKVVAITGSVGSVGKSLVSFLTELPVKEIVVIDNNESALHEQDIEYKSDGRITPRLMDITDQSGLTRAFAGVDLSLIHI